jgi:hypothetical protein
MKGHYVAQRTLITVVNINTLSIELYHYNGHEAQKRGSPIHRIKAMSGLMA